MILVVGSLEATWWEVLNIGISYRRPRPTYIRQITKGQWSVLGVTLQETGFENMLDARGVLKVTIRSLESRNGMVCSNGSFHFWENWSRGHDGDLGDRFTGRRTAHGCVNPAYVNQQGEHSEILGKLV